MKKHLLGALAVLLAIGFSAFTKPAPRPAMQQDFYWFPPGDQSEPQSNVDIATLTDEENDVCPGSSIACKDGYPSTQVTLSMGVYTASGLPTHQIKKSN